MNMALPLESLHVIYLGYRARKLKSDAATEDDTGAHYMFGEQYKRESQFEHKLIQLGELLQKQPDPEKPKTAFNSLLVYPDPENNSKTGKNRHMKCVECCLLYNFIWY